MTPRIGTRLAVIGILLALALAIGGCSVSSSTGGSTGGSSGGGTTGGTTTGGTTTGGTTTGGATTGGATTGGGGTTGAAPTATPHPAPPHALAWFQIDGSSVGQIWASINGGSPVQITHIAPSAAECRYDTHWSPPVFSPNLSHIVAAQGSAACTDGPENGQLYVVNATNGVPAAVPSATSVRLSLRESGWVDNNTIWWTDFNGLHEYTLGAASSTLVSNLGGVYPDDTVLRGNTLFYSVGSSSYALHRFDMTSHTVLAGSVNLGTTNPCACSRNDALSPGFDVSADGSHIAFQRVAAASGSGTQEGVGSSQFFYANADGSAQSQIASYATSNSMTHMQISPSGQLVAVARAEAPPSFFSASVTSPGNQNDPNLHFYNPDAHSYPVWKWDNTTFWVGTLDLGDDYPPTTGNMEHFDVGAAAGSVGAAGGEDPWYTIGS